MRVHVLFEIKVEKLEHEAQPVVDVDDVQKSARDVQLAKLMRYKARRSVLDDVSSSRVVALAHLHQD